MPPNKITIIAADDHPIVVNGIKLSLIDATEFEFVAEAFSEASLYSVLQEQTADLLILDLNFKGDNSLQYLDRIYQLRPHIKVIIFSSYNAPSLIKSAMSHRIHGYLLKDTPRAKLIDALHRIHAGERYLPPRMEGENNPFDSDHGLVDDFLKKNNLSHRELEVIQLIVDGVFADVELAG
ncbi:MAG: response regulator transcription factor, partial [Bacteroidota bacterium]